MHSWISAVRFSGGEDFLGCGILGLRNSGVEDFWRGYFGVEDFCGQGYLGFWGFLGLKIFGAE